MPVVGDLIFETLMVGRFPSYRKLSLYHFRFFVLSRSFTTFALLFAQLSVCFFAVVANLREDRRPA